MALQEEYVKNRYYFSKNDCDTCFYIKVVRFIFELISYIFPKTFEKPEIHKIHL